LIWLVRRRCLSTRDLVTLELTRTFTPRHRSALVDIILSKRVRQSLVWKHLIPGGMRVPRALCRPRFSFFNIQLSKNRHRRRGVVGQSAFALLALSSVAHAALLISPNLANIEANFFVASSVAAVVGVAYIVADPSDCQQRF